MTLEELINEAVAHYLKTKNHLPLKFLRAEKGNNNIYKLWFIDTDIEYTLQHVFLNNNSFATSKAQFYATVSDELLAVGTLTTDLLANIPSDIVGDKKVILRIAGAIHNAYRTHVFNCYKLVEKNPTKLTGDNARKWRDAIK